jgi:hypothetical protein
MALIGHERYTELLSKMINRVASEAEERAVEQFEAAQPKNCPKCGANVWTFLEPHRVSHDVENCNGKRGNSK